MKDMRLQNSMGRVEEHYRPDMNMGGSLSVGKVLNVHHFSGTVDVELVNTKDQISSSPENKGRFAARIMSEGGWFDEDNKVNSWGSIRPITKGCLVVVAFLDGMKNRPLILGQLPRGDNEENVLPVTYPLKDKQPGYQRREALKHLTIYPSMGYKKVDGEGNVEISMPSKSFLAAYSKSMDAEVEMNDSHGGFDHEHLSEVNKKTGQVYETDMEEAKAPMKLLFVHRDSFEGSNRRTKFYIDDKGMVRVTRDNDDNTLSYIEMGEDGGIVFRRQVDSDVHEEGSKYGEYRISPDGTTSQRTVGSEGESHVTLTPDGNGDIHIAKSLRISAGERVDISAPVFTYPVND